MSLRVKSTRKAVVESERPDITRSVNSVLCRPRKPLALLISGLLLAGSLSMAVVPQTAEAASIPSFTEQTGTANPFDGFDVGLGSTPALADVDGDGDLDAFVGNHTQANRVWLNGDTIDLSITKTSNQVVVVQGGPLTYTIVVGYTGPDGVTGATVNNPFPTQLPNTQLTELVSAGGAVSSRSPGSLAGALTDTVDLPNGS